MGAKHSVQVVKYKGSLWSTIYPRQLIDGVVSASIDMKTKEADLTFEEKGSFYRGRIINHHCNLKNNPIRLNFGTQSIELTVEKFDDREIKGIYQTENPQDRGKFSLTRE